MLRVQELGSAELARVAEIDRSERVGGFFVVENGALRLVERELEIPTWTADELAETRRRLTATLATGGAFLGVLDGSALVAGAVLGGAPLPGVPARLELVFLHVSRTHRRRGLAGLLFDESCRRAREAGAAQLYISSSDVAPAVRFYLARGCALAARIDRVIAARWPEDVPLVLDL